jgi:ATP phosphoribosyltransferase
MSNTEHEPASLAETSSSNDATTSTSRSTGIGKCRLVVAGLPSTSLPAVPRVATKYARIATEHFASKGVQAEVIFVQGSVELAPLVGLADLIVDLVETGSTLKENGLVEHELIAEISSVVVANRSLFKLRHAEVSETLERLRRASSAGGRSRLPFDSALQRLIHVNETPRDVGTIGVTSFTRMPEKSSP